MDESDPSRDAVHEAIQQNLPTGREAILTGWVVVAEWMDHQGERWLSKGYSASLTAWSARGMHHEVLYGNWPDAEGET
jgi:hypothetical protein